MSVVSDIILASSEVQNDRTLESIVAHMMSEVEELNVEVACVRMGLEEGYDGVVGEAVDVILCAVDIIHKHNPSLTEEDILAIVQKKISKWKTLYSKV